MGEGGADMKDAVPQGRSGTAGKSGILKRGVKHKLARAQALSISSFPALHKAAV
jgi:hypothetical protein